MNGKQPHEFADLASALQGVTVTIITPFTADAQDVDIESLRNNVHYVASSGISAIIPAGNTGEFSSLTDEEIRRISELTVREVEKRKKVLIGIGGDIRSSVQLARFAQDIGADGVLIHEPGHTFVSANGLYDYYGAICQAVDFGVVIYKRTPRLDDRVLARVAQTHINVVGIKYAWSDVAAFLQLRTELPERVTCACGSAERWALPFSAAGAVGFTSGIANFVPELSVALLNALREGGSDALSLWREIVPLEDIRSRKSSALNVPVIKYAMDLFGLAGGSVRPPLSALDDDEQQTVRRIVQRWVAWAPKCPPRAGGL